MLLKLNEETKTLLVALDDMEATAAAIALGNYKHGNPYLDKHIHEMASAIFEKSLELHQLVLESEEFYADTE